MFSTLSTLQSLYPFFVVPSARSTCTPLLLSLIYLAYSSSFKQAASGVYQLSFLLHTHICIHSIPLVQRQAVCQHLHCTFVVVLAVASLSFSSSFLSLLDIFCNVFFFFNLFFVVRIYLLSFSCFTSFVLVRSLSSVYFVIINFPILLNIFSGPTGF